MGSKEASREGREESQEGLAQSKRTLREQEPEIKNLMVLLLFHDLVKM